MAAVYEVVDCANQRRLALKQFRPTAATDVKRGRVLFEREYHTLSQLSHPCIVSAFDYGDDEAGPYYTMELIEGEDLRALAPMPWREACSVLRDVASALAAVHARRLIHRDLSYRNARCPSDGRAKLLDFGALATFGVASDVAGMAPFVSPEALRGRRLDARSDLFSLGCLAYWLLTGRLAFDAQRNDELEAMWALGALPPSAIVGSVPEALDGLVAALMHLDPGARPQSAADVISRLSAVAGLPDEDARVTARAYLASPRLCARDREVERIRRRVAMSFERPSPSPSSDVTGRFRTQRADSSRATVDLTPSLGSTAAPSTKKPNIVVIAGAAGTGRTRMLQELVVEAKLAGARALSVCAAAVRQAPYELAARLVEELLVQRPDLLKRLPAESRLLIEGLRAGPEPVPNEGIGQPIALQERRVKTAHALAELFEAAAADSGLLIAVDDVHRCDEPSATALMTIAGRTHGQRILLAMTRDVGARARATSVIDWLEARAIRVDLEPLDAVAVDELTRSLFGSSPHVRALGTWLFGVSAGNPFVCIELLDHLIAEGTIRYDGGVWLLPEDPAAQGLPETLTAMLQARVAGLTPRARAVAELLSLFDAPLPIDQCIELVDLGSDQAVFEAVDELILHGLCVGDGTTHRLAHEQLREVVRERMDDDRRRALHKRVGELLLSQWPQTSAEILEAAYHLIEGDEAARGASLLARLSRSNPFFALLAGPRAARVLERALESAPQQSAARRLALQIPLLIQRSDLEAGDARLGDAVIEQLSRDIGLDRFALLGSAGEAHRRLRQVIDESQRRFEATPKSERGLPPLEALVRLPPCVMNLARMHAVACDIRAVQRLVRVVEPYRHLGEIGRTVYDSVLALIESLQGRNVAADERYERMLQSLESPAHRMSYSPFVFHLWRCELHAMTGTRCADQHAVAIEQAQHLERSGVETHQYEAMLIRMLVHLRRAEQTRAERLGDALEELLVQQRGGWHHRGWLAVLKSMAYSRLGDTLALKQCISRLADMHDTFPHYHPYEQTTRGYYLYHVGDHPAALAMFDAVLDVNAPGEHEVWRHAARGRALALVAQERHAEALAYMQQAIAHAAVVGVGDAQLKRPLAPLLLQCRAELGEADAAALTLDASIAALSQEDRGPLLLVEAHCARARVAILQERPDLARAATKAAEQHVRRAESRALVASYERWLERTRRSRFPPPP